MPRLDDHPSVRRHRATPPPSPPLTLDADELRRLALDAGADDVGLVALDRPELDDQRDEILALYPWARTLVALVGRMNREPVRSPARSVANLEFHHAGDRTDEAARALVRALESRGVRAVNPALGMPMEMNRFPGKTWIISHKPVAVAAGLGAVGLHRNVIHPKFGSFVLLATVVVGADVSEQSRPLDFNPCLGCKLCVAACPVGAISADGHFDFSACITHNYREFLGGFGDWVETVAVCPAGDDVLAPFLDDRKTFLAQVVDPLQQKPEPVYVVPGSDAEDHVRRRFPHKRVRRVGNGLRPSSIAGFLSALPHVFQRRRAAGLDATYHFSFTGREPAKATVVIRDGTLRVDPGHVGTPNLHVRADSAAWLAFLRKDRGLVGALLRRKIILQGPPRLLLAFGRCFPS
jgi:ferredoxin